VFTTAGNLSRGGQALDKYLEVADLPPLSPASDPVGLFSVIASHQARGHAR